MNDLLPVIRMLRALSLIWEPTIRSLSHAVDNRKGALALAYADRLRRCCDLVGSMTSELLQEVDIDTFADPASVRSRGITLWNPGHVDDFIQAFYSPPYRDELRRAFDDLYESLEVVFSRLLPECIESVECGATPNALGPLLMELAREIGHVVYHLETDIIESSHTKMAWSNIPQ